MKIVINKCFGGFSISGEVAEAMGLRSPYGPVERTNPYFVEMVEKNADAASGRCAKLKVVEIPDEATDWEIDEYDGLESITYVVDGKLYHI